MNLARNFSTVTLVRQLGAGLLGALAFAQPALAQHSWLDRPLENWNRPAGVLPQLPQPSTPQGESANADRCRAQVRNPASAAEQALARRGWLLYGPVYSYDSTRIVTALSDFDGMCRPLGYHAFVYWDGRYAGTLSPVAMNSRQDGALTNVHLSGMASFSADFARYRQADPLCCPSRVDTVTYDLRRDDIPTLAAVQVIRPAARPANEKPASCP